MPAFGAVRWVTGPCVWEPAPGVDGGGGGGECVTIGQHLTGLAGEQGRGLGN